MFLFAVNASKIKIFDSEDQSLFKTLDRPDGPNCNSGKVSCTSFNNKMVHVQKKKIDTPLTTEKKLSDDFGRGLRLAGRDPSRA